MDQVSDIPEPRASTSWLALFLVLAASLHFFGGNVADPDLWGHLRYGQMILDGHGLPREDVFSYTAYGAPFYDHEWLSDLVFAPLYAVGGSAGILLLKLAACAVMVLAMLDAIRSTGERLTPGERGAPAAGRGGGDRGARGDRARRDDAPAALHHALPRRRDRAPAARRPAPARRRDPAARARRRCRRSCWCGRICTAASWSGWGCSASTAARRCAEALLGRLRGAAMRCCAGDRSRPWSRSALLAVAAPLVNPYGVGLYTYLADTLGMHEEISEWHPVELLSGEFLRFKLLCAASCAAVAVLWARRDRPRTATVLLAWMVPFLGVAAVLAFRHQRHTVLFGIAAAPLLTVAAEQVRRWAIARWPLLVPRPPVFAAAACGAVAIALVQLYGFAAMTARDGMSIRYGRIDYPVDAVEFLRTHGIHGNVAMPFEWGAYAISKLGAGVARLHRWPLRGGLSAAGDRRLLRVHARHRGLAAAARRLSDRRRRRAALAQHPPAAVRRSELRLRLLRPRRAGLRAPLAGQRRDPDASRRGRPDGLSTAADGLSMTRRARLTVARPAAGAILAALAVVVQSAWLASVYPAAYLDADLLSYLAYYRDLRGGTPVAFGYTVPKLLPILLYGPLASPRLALLVSVAIAAAGGALLFTVARRSFGGAVAVVATLLYVLDPMRGVLTLRSSVDLAVGVALLGAVCALQRRAVLLAGLMILVAALGKPPALACALVLPFAAGATPLRRALATALPFVALPATVLLEAALEGRALADRADGAVAARSARALRARRRGAGARLRARP